MAICANCSPPAPTRLIPQRLYLHRSSAIRGVCFSTSRESFSPMWLELVPFGRRRFVPWYRFWTGDDGLMIVAEILISWSMPPRFEACQTKKAARSPHDRRRLRAGDTNSDDVGSDPCFEGAKKRGSFKFFRLGTRHATLFVQASVFEMNLSFSLSLDHLRKTYWQISRPHSPHSLDKALVATRRLLLLLCGRFVVT